MANLRWNGGINDLTTISGFTILHFSFFPFVFRNPLPSLMFSYVFTSTTSTSFWASADKLRWKLPSLEPRIAPWQFAVLAVVERPWYPG